MRPATPLLLVGIVLIGACRLTFVEPEPPSEPSVLTARVLQVHALDAAETEPCLRVIVTVIPGFIADGSPRGMEDSLMVLDGGGLILHPPSVAHIAWPRPSVHVPPV